MRRPDFWQTTPPTLLARALAPIGTLYGHATLRRMAQPAPSVPAPVVCVGNFVAGGAGKTPAAIALGQMLFRQGRRVAFLSRGYGGDRRAEPLRVDPNAHAAAGVGDEPLLLARTAPCYVGPDRRASAEEALRDGADVLVLDDGLQSPTLAKDLSFAVVDGADGFGNGLCLPAGPLRAPVAGQAPFVDAAIVVERDGAGTADLSALLDLTGFGARLAPDAGVAATLIGRPVYAFAGIGAPEKFFQTLRGLGAILAATRSFPDHARFGDAELRRMLADARQRQLTPVTTEKDAVRLPPDLRRHVVALPVALVFDEPAEVDALLRAGLAKGDARRSGA